MLKKIVLVRYGLFDLEEGEALKAEGHSGKVSRLLTGFLRHEKVAVLYPPRLVTLSLHMLANELGTQAVPIDHDLVAKYARDSERCGLAPYGRFTAILLTGSRDDQLRFRNEFVKSGFRDISRHLTEKKTPNIHAPGSFWCADLERRILHCGRCSPNS